MDNTCEFCCKPVKYTSVDHASGIQLVDVLDFLNLNPAILYGKDSACQECNEKIISAYTFKKNCAQLEKDFLVLDSHSTKVDLRQLLQDKGKLEQLVEDEIQICRLCLSILDCDAVTPLRELLEEEDMRTVFREQIPEINLQAVENPVICGICTKDLNNLKDLLFLSRRFEIAIPNITEDDKGNVQALIDALAVDESDMDANLYIKTEWDNDVFDGAEELDAKIKIEFVEIKPLPPLIVDPVQLKREEIYVKPEEMERLTAESTGWMRDAENEEREMKLHERAESSIEPKRAGIHVYESRSARKAKLKVDLHKCHKCSFATAYARSLRQHILLHKEKSEVYLHKCKECSFATRYAQYLKSHMWVHLDKSEVALYKCQECSYGSKWAGDLKKHMMVHKAKLEVDLYKCPECPYAGKLVRHLKRHMLVHKAKSEVNLYKCHECSYAAKRGDSLKRHMLVHKAVSLVDLYKCHECSYVGKRAGLLKSHMLVHKDKSEFVLYRCDKCSFATKHAKYLKTHSMLLHKDKF